MSQHRLQPEPKPNHSSTPELQRRTHEVSNTVSEITELLRLLSLSYLAFPITNIFELICHIVSLKDCFLSSGWNMTCFGRICIMLLCKFLSSSLIFPNTTLRFSFDKKTLLIYRRVTSPLWALGACSGSKTSSCRLCWSGRVTETSQVNSPQNGGINPPPFVVLSECLLQRPETPRRVKRIRGVTFLPRGLDIGLRFPLLQSALS